MRATILLLVGCVLVGCTAARQPADPAAASDVPHVTWVIQTINADHTREDRVCGSDAAGECQLVVSTPETLRHAEFVLTIHSGARPATVRGGVDVGFLGSAGQPARMNVNQADSKPHPEVQIRSNVSGFVQDVPGEYVVRIDLAFAFAGGESRSLQETIPVRVARASPAAQPGIVAGSTLRDEDLARGDAERR